MANKVLTTGGNLCEVFSIASNAFDTVEIALSLIISTDITYNDDGTITLTPTQEEDSAALQSFIDEFGPDPDSSEVAPRIYEDSTNSGATVTGSQPEIGFIAYGGVNDDGRKVYYGRGLVGKGTGSSKWEAGKPSNPKFVLNSVKASAATTVAAAKFNTSKVTAPGGAKTIAEGAKYVCEFLAEA